MRLSDIAVARTISSNTPATARSFLFVCFGNIMRSPMCEALMKRALSSHSDAFTVTSAGLNAEPGRRAHPWAICAASDLGISLEPHRAQPLTEKMINQADIIFAMDFQNQAEILSRFPNSKNKLFMLGTYGGRSVQCEIRDPYHFGQEATRECYQILDTCIRNLVLRIPAEVLN